MSEAPEDLRQWRLPRGRHGLPRELVERSQRERLLAAVVRVTVAKGYEKTTVADILGEAGVGRESFYELFNDKLDCLLAAHKLLVDNLAEQVREAYLTEGPWPQRVRSSLRTTLEWFASDPDVSHFTLIDMSTIGPPFRPIFQAEYARFMELFDEGRDQGAPNPELPHATNLAIGATMAKIYEEVLTGRAAELPRLLPELTYCLLVPFLGEEEARAVASADGDGDDDAQP
jgi:AcrR family transcriptional regulator